MASVLLSACSSIRQSQPERTATEQLLISAAADRAIAALDVDIAPGTRVQVRADSLEAYDERYVLGSLRDRLLRDGMRLVDVRSEAEVVLEVRAGALSIDRHSDLVGIPSLDIPIPLAGTYSTPEIAIIKRERQEGIAKLAVTSYAAESGALNGSSGPVYGNSTHDRWVFLIFDWTEEDIGKNAAKP